MFIISIFLRNDDYLYVVDAIRKFILSALRKLCKSALVAEKGLRKFQLSQETTFEFCLFLYCFLARKLLASCLRNDKSGFS